MLRAAGPARGVHLRNRKRHQGQRYAGRGTLPLLLLLLPQLLLLLLLLLLLPLLLLLLLLRLRLRRLRLLYNRSAGKCDVLAETELLAQEEDAGGGALGPPQRALHLLPCGELHVDEVDLKHCIANAYEPTFCGGARRFQAGNLVEAVVAAHELHADATRRSLEGQFHRERECDNDAKTTLGMDGVERRFKCGPATTRQRRERVQEGRRWREEAAAAAAAAK